MTASLSDIRNFLEVPRTIAVIGASKKKHRAGHYVPKFLQTKGWQIIPVNPYEDNILGEESLDSQSEISGEIDGMIIYRNPKDAEQEALIAIESNRTPVIWFPDNVTSSKVVEKAQQSGVLFIQDRCPLRDYRRLIE